MKKQNTGSKVAVQPSRLRGLSSACYLSLSWLFIFALVLSAAGTSALTITSPSEGTIFVGETQVNFTWDESPVEFDLTGYAPENIVGTSINKTLGVGEFTAKVTNQQNTSQSVSFEVIAANPPQNNPSQIITLTTDRSTYELGVSVRIRVQVTTPEQLSLQVARAGGGTDSYNINVQQQTDFLYSPTGIGNYVITAQGSSTSATSSFSVQNTSMTLTITGDSTGSAGRVSNFGSAVAGGTAPYTYLWSFSDGTTSAGSTAEHVFAQSGTYTATLTATDSVGKTASATKTINVEELSLRLTVTVLGKNNRLLNSSVVTLIDSRGSKSAVTDVLGSVTFNNLSASTYVVSTVYVANEISPAQTYTDNRSITLSNDRSITVNLPVPEPGSTVTGEQISNSDLNPALQKTIEEQTVETQATQAALATQQSEIEAATMELERARTDALTELRGIHASMTRSETRAEAISVLGLDRKFSEAEATITRASTTQEIVSALAKIPKELTILALDTVITKTSYSDMEEDIVFYLETTGADKEKTKNLKYTLRQQSEEFSITSKRTVVRVTYYGGAQAETYTIFTRQAPQMPDYSYLEIIPKSIATDASELRIKGSHEVVHADPIIRFLTNEYSYYVQGEPEGLPGIVPLPDELLEAKGLAGLVSFRFDMTSFERGSLYLVLLGIIVALLFAGNMYVRKLSSKSPSSFQEVAELTIGLAEQGNYEAASKYLAELESLFNTLPPQEQNENAQVLTVLKDTCALSNFRAANDALLAVLALDDLIATSNAYDKTLAIYESLSSEVKQNQSKIMAQSQEAVEKQIQEHEMQLSNNQTLEEAQA